MQRHLMQRTGILAKVLARMASCALVVCAMTPIALGQDPLTDKVVLELPSMEEVAIDPDLVYKEVDGQQLTFDLYRPKGARAEDRFPLVFFVNGVGDRELPLKHWGPYRSWAKLCAASGMAAVLHNAREGQTAEDLADAVTQVREQAPKLGIDPDNICIWASSANLQTGFPYATDVSNTFVKCAVFYYGALDSTRVRHDLPVLVARAGLDMPWQNVTVDAYVARSLVLNAPLTLLNLPNGRHGFDVIDKNDASREMVRSTLAFMKQNLSGDVQRARLERAAQANALSLVAGAKYADALDSCRRWVAEDGENGLARQTLATCLYHLRQFEEACANYERAGDLGHMPALTWYNAACCRALLKDKDHALVLLEKAFATGRITNLQAVRDDTDLASLKDEPRFQKLVQPAEKRP